MKLKKIIQKLLKESLKECEIEVSEDLVYAHSDTDGAEDDEYEIGVDSDVAAFNTDLAPDPTKRSL